MIGKYQLIDIMNDLELIGTGIEGSVYRGKLDGQNIACKRVKTKEETNIKHLKKLNHINVIKFRVIFHDIHCTTIILYSYGILCIWFII